MKPYLIFPFVFIFLASFAAAESCHDMDSVEEKDDCFYSYAKKFFRSSYCKNIIDVDLKQECYNSVFELCLEKGSTSTISLGNNIINLTSWDNCHFSRGSTAVDGVQYCNKVNNSIIKDLCLFYVSKFDSSACDYMDDNFEKTKCFQDTNNTDIKKCDLLTDYHKDTCYTTVAIKTNNVDYCTLSESTDNNDFCFDRFAKNQNNTSYCHKITNDGKMNSCYYDMAYQLNNHKICKKMKILERGKTKKGCVGRVLYSGQYPLNNFQKFRVWLHMFI